MNNKKDILIIAATHGNEQFSIPVIKQLKKQYPGKFDWIIGNKLAIKENKRFVDTDLNRSAPGNQKSKLYEQQRAWQLMKIANKYRFVIDIHGTPAKTGLFTIVCNPIPENLLLAGTLPIDRVVIWSDIECKKSGPITQFVPCGLEIECGPKYSRVIQRKLFNLLKNIVTKGISCDSIKFNKKQWFRAYGKLIIKGGDNKFEKKLKEFTKTKINKEVFYPLLIGRYQKVLCYKLEEVSWRDLFSF